MSPALLWLSVFSEQVAPQFQVHICPISSLVEKTYHFLIVALQVLGSFLCGHAWSILTTLYGTQGALALRSDLASLLITGLDTEKGGFPKVSYLKNEEWMQGRSKHQ